jgi:alpha-L-fucosidase
MAVNADAIHGTRPLAPYKAGKVALTRRGSRVHAIYLAAEGEAMPERISVPVAARPGSAARLLGSPAEIPWDRTAAGIDLRVPPEVAKAPPCAWAWTFVMEVE